MSDRFDRQRLIHLGFWVAFVVLSMISLVPLWSVRIPPMQDIWQHLALVDVLHNYDAPGSVFPDYFELPRTPKPNLLYYYGTHFLAYLTPSLEDANKVILSFYIVAFPASFLYFLLSFGRSRWLAFFSFPLVYNSMFSYGFVSFVLGMPLLLLAVGAYRRFVAREGWDLDFRAGGLAALVILLTFFTHAHIYLLACFLGGLLFLMHRDRGWGTVLRLAPFAPGLVFFVPWFFVYFIEQTPSSTGMQFGSFDNFFGPTFYRPSQILGSFFYYVGDYFRGERDDALFVTLVLASMTLLMLRRGPTIPAGETRKMRHYDLEVLTVVLAASALILPQHIEAQSIVSLRHVVFAVLFYFGWLGVEDVPKRVAVPALLLVMGLHVGGVANLVKGYGEFQRELNGYPALFDRVNGGERLLKSTYNQESRVVTHGALWHMHFFYTILKGGISDLQFAEYPHNPIQYKPGMVPPRTGVDFSKSPVWRFYEYVLLRKSSAPSLKTVEDRLDVVAENDEWVLFHASESPVPRGPDEDPLPNPRRAVLDAPNADTFGRILRSEPEILRPPTHFRAIPGARPSPRDMLRQRGDELRPAGPPTPRRPQSR